MTEPIAPVTDWGNRTPADLSSLLLELGRAVRGAGFYAENDPRRPDLLDRAYRAFKSEITRVTNVTGSLL